MNPSMTIASNNSSSSSNFAISTLNNSSINGATATNYGKLIVLKRNGQDSAGFELTDSLYTFGRNPSSDIRIQLESIADLHCRLVRNDRGQMILQTMAPNCKINNKEIQSHENFVLSSGDIITVVERSFRFESLSKSNQDEPILLPRTPVKSTTSLVITPIKAMVEAGISGIGLTGSSIPNPTGGGSKTSIKPSDLKNVIFPPTSTGKLGSPRRVIDSAKKKNFTISTSTSNILSPSTTTNFIKEEKLKENSTLHASTIPPPTAATNSSIWNIQEEKISKLGSPRRDNPSTNSFTVTPVKNISTPGRLGSPQRIPIGMVATPSSIPTSIPVTETESKTMTLINDSTINSIEIQSNNQTLLSTANITDSKSMEIESTINENVIKNTPISIERESMINSTISPISNFNSISNNDNHTPISTLKKLATSSPRLTIPGTPTIVDKEICASPKFSKGEIYTNDNDDEFQIQKETLEESFIMVDQRSTCPSTINPMDIDSLLNTEAITIPTSIPISNLNLNLNLIPTSMKHLSLKMEMENESSCSFSSESLLPPSSITEKTLKNQEFKVKIEKEKTHQKHHRHNQQQEKEREEEMNSTQETIFVESTQDVLFTQPITINQEEESKEMEMEIIHSIDKQHQEQEKIPIKEMEKLENSIDESNHQIERMEKEQQEKQDCKSIPSFSLNSSNSPFSSKSTIKQEEKIKGIKQEEIEMKLKKENPSIPTISKTPSKTISAAELIMTSSAIKSSSNRNNTPKTTTIASKEQNLLDRSSSSIERNSLLIKHGKETIKMESDESTMMMIDDEQINSDKITNKSQSQIDIDNLESQSSLKIINNDSKLLLDSNHNHNHNQKMTMEMEIKVENPNESLGKLELNLESKLELKSFTNTTEIINDNVEIVSIDAPVNNISSITDAIINATTFADSNVKVDSINVDVNDDSNIEIDAINVMIDTDNDAIVKTDNDASNVNDDPNNVMNVMNANIDNSPILDTVTDAMDSSSMDNINDSMIKDCNEENIVKSMILEEINDESKEIYHQSSSSSNEKLEKKENDQNDNENAPFTPRRSSRKIVSAVAITPSLSIGIDSNSKSMTGTRESTRLKVKDNNKVEMDAIEEIERLKSVSERRKSIKGKNEMEKEKEHLHSNEESEMESKQDEKEKINNHKNVEMIKILSAKKRLGRASSKMEIEIDQVEEKEESGSSTIKKSVKKPTLTMEKEDKKEREKTLLSAKKNEKNNEKTDEEEIVSVNSQRKRDTRSKELEIQTPIIVEASLSTISSSKKSNKKEKQEKEKESSLKMQEKKANAGKERASVSQSAKAVKTASSIGTGKRALSAAGTLASSRTPATVGRPRTTMTKTSSTVKNVAANKSTIKKSSTKKNLLTEDEREDSDVLSPSFLPKAARRKNASASLVQDKENNTNNINKTTTDRKRTATKAELFEEEKSPPKRRSGRSIVTAT